MPDYYKVNGGIYINAIEEVTETTSFNDNPIGFVMKQNHSIDIDEIKDIVVAEFYMRQDEFETVN